MADKVNGDLISRQALMQYPIRINHYDKEHGNEVFVLGIESVLEYAENLPTIEAETVVRCKLCQNLQPLDEYNWLAGECTVLHNKVTADFYCAFGKRKDGGGNG